MQAHVYVLAFQDKPYFKVGKANSLPMRLSQLKHWGKLEREECLALRCRNEKTAHKIEKAIHGFFDFCRFKEINKRLDGSNELFELSYMEAVKNQIETLVSIYGSREPIEIVSIPKKLPKKIPPKPKFVPKSIPEKKDPNSIYACDLPRNFEEVFLKFKEGLLTIPLVTASYKRTPLKLISINGLKPPKEEIDDNFGKLHLVAPEEELDAWMNDWKNHYINQDCGLGEVRSYPIPNSNLSRWEGSFSRYKLKNKSDFEKIEEFLKGFCTTIPKNNGEIAKG